MTDWSDLTAELDAWRDSGRRATVWWRDDDAVEPTAALERLLDLAGRHGLALALAVVPARASEALARRIAEVGPWAGPRAVPRAVPVQHGFAHLNHAPPGERKRELGTHRPLAEVLEELARGRARMDALFGGDWLPVMVPPWNRIADEVVAALVPLGYRGLSADGPRRGVCAAPGVVQVNTHVDIMRWDAPRGFLGAGPSLQRLLGHLADRRLGRADPEEPTGLLTHHLAHDAGCWDFLERLWTALLAHPAVAVAGPRAVFSPGRGAAPGIAGNGARGVA